MKPHIAIYIEHFPEPKCEVCGIHAIIDSDGIHGLDVHHIEGRGKGKDVIENLMGLCRKHHEDYGQKKQFKEFLTNVHNKKLNELHLPY